MYTDDGENWILETTLPPGNYDFKCIKYKAGKNGGMGEWERGSDRNIEVSVGISGMDVSCEFGDTSKTKVCGCVWWCVVVNMPLVRCV